MSWTYQQQSNNPYVENRCSSASVPSTPAQSAQFWPTPTPESGLRQNLNQTVNQNPQIPQQQLSKEPYTKFGRTSKPANSQLPQLHTSASASQTQRGPFTAPVLQQPQSPFASTVTSHRDFSSPNVFVTPQIQQQGFPLNTPQSNPTISTPPMSNTQSQRTPQRRSTNLHPQQSQENTIARGMMGPPETPSRGMIPQSPDLFSGIQFSPDMFSQQAIDNNANQFPQQRLFWDPSMGSPLNPSTQTFQTPVPFSEDFTSFTSTSTVMQPNFGQTPQPHLPYDLPLSQPMDNSFMETASFPAPFQTSPRPNVPTFENPTLFLSSPARRFGGEPSATAGNIRRSIPELPAYHHQIQDSKREREAAVRERRKSRTLKKAQRDDLVMRSVRRALSPSKNPRASLQRSATYGTIPENTSFSENRMLDDMSIDSYPDVDRSRTSLGGVRSSPLRQIRDVGRGISKVSTLRRSKSSVSLSIDHNGTARTVMDAVPEYDDMDDASSGNSTDVLPSDEDDDQILHSFQGDPYGNYDTPLHRQHNALHALRSDVSFSDKYNNQTIRARRVASAHNRALHSDISQTTNTVRRFRADTLNSTSTADTGDAKQALRLLIQERSRSASSHNSSSSIQFHSSPPMQNSQLPFSALRGSSATHTDPDLLTPSTDADSVGSHMAMRCVCGGTNMDGNIMLQCDSCTKWLHAKCVGLTNRIIPEVYVCQFCAQTPNRNTIARGAMRQSLHAERSPLAHKVGKNIAR